jgi:4-amino-4-deoxy-L-arabinose transferase-like glycosyltransferase
MDRARSQPDATERETAIPRQTAIDEVPTPPGRRRARLGIPLRHGTVVAGLMLFGLVFFLTGLGQRSLWAPDEGRYAEIPREMVVSGDWLTPRLNGAKYFEKPPLHYWLVGAAFRLLGQTELAARLPCALSAIGGLLLVYGFGAACFGARTGLLAALLLAVSPLYFILGRMDIIDTPLMVFYTVGMTAWGLALLRRGGARGSAPLALCGWAGLALATLVKGPVALVLAVGTVLLWLLLTRQWNRWRALHPLPGLALYLAIAAPWFIAVSLKNPEFPWFFFVHEHLLRFLTTEHERKGPVYYYVPVLLIGFFPWSAWLPAATIAAVRASVLAYREGRPLREEHGSPRDTVATGAGRDRPTIIAGTAEAASDLSPCSREASAWLLLWAAIPFVFFSASGSKLITYVLPAFPALALLVAVWWPRGRATQESGTPGANLTHGSGPAAAAHAEWASLRRGAMGATGGAALLAVLLPLLPRLVRKDTAPGVEPWLALAAAALAAGALLTPILARQREPARLALALIGVAAGLLFALDRVELVLDSVRGMRDLAEPVRARPEARLVMVNTYDQAFNFYSRQRAIIVGGVGELAFGRDHALDAADYFRQEESLPALLAERTPTFFLIHRKDRERLKPLFEGRANLVKEGRKHLLLLAPGDENVAR